METHTLKQLQDKAVFHRAKLQIGPKTMPAKTPAYLSQYHQNELQRSI